MTFGCLGIYKSTSYFRIHRRDVISDSYFTPIFCGPNTASAYQFEGSKLTWLSKQAVKTKTKTINTSIYYERTKH
jgi:hypothetical protein